jgi:hypothetical protein
MRFLLSLTALVVIAFGQEAPAPAELSETVGVENAESDKSQSKASTSESEGRKEKETKIEKRDANDSDEGEEWYCRTVRTARLRSFPELFRNFASKLGILRRERVEFCTKPDGSVRIYDKEKNIINTGSLAPETSDIQNEPKKNEEKRDGK